MFNVPTEDWVRTRVAEHERLVAKLRLEREGLACQRDHEQAVRRAPRLRPEAFLGGFRLGFRGR